MLFTLHTPTGPTEFDRLEDLDAAFDVALKEHAPPAQVSAETSKTINGQGIGRTHAYRLDDGRIFRRSLADWDSAEMSESEPRQPYATVLAERNRYRHALANIIARYGAHSPQPRNDSDHGALLEAEQMSLIAEEALACK